MGDETTGAAPERDEAARDAQPGVSENAAHGTAEAGGALPPADALTAELAEATLEIESLKDQVLRAQAEAENTRRRAQREVENAHRYALEKFLAELLPVLDSLEKAVEVARQSDGAGAIAEGVELSLRMFLSIMEKAGIEQIDPRGQPFDPRHHEAMATIASPDSEANSVLDVMQKGYVLNGRLVRAAKVVVSKAPE
jgi:molecular chaperone GrpE